MQCIKIYYSAFEIEEMSLYFDRLLMKMPKQTQAKVLRYKQPKDRHLVLLGRLLLLRALSFLDPPIFIEDIEIDKFGRPFIADNNIDFNISHSGCIAVCALSCHGKIGIDIERKREINLEGFKKHMTAAQWYDIYNTHNNLDRFFYYWTFKEAVLKADGRGLRTPLSLIKTDSDGAFLDGRYWYTKELPIDPNYACHIASDGPIGEVSLHDCKLSDFL